VRPTVYLFDIDGTLLDSKGAGRCAMEQAFTRVTGDRESMPRMRFAGMTDRFIVREALLLAGREPSESTIDDVLDAYLERLGPAIAATEGYTLHGGVHEVLDHLERRERVALGLGTGNLQRGAELKLTPVGIYQRFAFGGFGSDHEYLAELLRVGAERGAARLGLSRPECRVVVIGDTPRDVEAAFAIGAECFAVATGFFDCDTLRSCGATRTFEDLPTLLRGQVHTL
jgi:phosphoglycolate phosphatase-like HAD superfamily hydrolase